jgi:hypothetical protein
MGPLQENDPLLAKQVPCYLCKQRFAPGDYVTMTITGPADEEEAKKAAAGHAYTVTGQVIHWDCHIKKDGETDNEHDHHADAAFGDQ